MQRAAGTCPTPPSTYHSIAPPWPPKAARVRPAVLALPNRNPPLGQTVKTMLGHHIAHLPGALCEQGEHPALEPPLKIPHPGPSHRDRAATHFELSGLAVTVAASADSSTGLRRVDLSHPSNSQLRLQANLAGRLGSDPTPILPVLSQTALDPISSSMM